MSSATLNQIYTVLDKTQVRNLVKYNQMFSIVMTRSLLDIDRAKFQLQLKQAWIAYKNDASVSVDLQLQEEFTETSTGRQLWMISYSVRSGQKMFDVQLDEDISASLLASHVTLMVHGTSKKYADSFFSTTKEKLVRNSDLFVLYTSGRVGEVNRGQFSSGIQQAWNIKYGETKVIALDIVSEDEVLDEKSPMSFWRLSYRVTTNKQSPQSTARNTRALQTSDVNKIKVKNVHNENYAIWTWDYTPVQKSKTFGIVLSQRVFKDDTARVLNVVVEAVAANLDGVTANDLTVGTYQEKVVSSQSQVGWSLTYIFKHNGKLIDASRQPQLDASALQRAMNFTTPRHTSYKVYSTSYNGEYEGFRKSTDQFTINFAGLVPTYVTSKLEPVLKSTWEPHLKNQKVRIQSLRREEYIGTKGMTVTRMVYFVDSDSKPVYPSLTLTPDPTDVVTKAKSSLGSTLQLYKGSDMRSVDSCYKLFVYRGNQKINTENLRISLIDAWNSTKDFSRAHFEILKSEKYIGAFGSQLTGFLYTVRYMGSDGKSWINAEPDVILEPETSQISNLLADARLYSGKMKFRHADLHQVQLSGSLNRSKIMQLETTLLSLWNSSVYKEKKMVTNVSVTVVGVEDTVDMATRQIIPKVSYTLDVADAPVTSWETRPLLIKDLQTAVTEDFGSDLELWTNLTNTLRQIYFEGDAKTNYGKKGELTSAVVTAYSSANNVTEDTVNLQLVEEQELSEANYVTDNLWSPVTVFKYGLSVNNTEADEISPPTDEELSRALTPHNVKVAGVARKLRKLYLVGAKADMNYTAVGISVRMSWSQTNTDLNTAFVGVHMKTPSSRHSRDTSLSSEYMLVGKNGEEITPVQFTVSVNGEEPNKALVSPPEDMVLDENLKHAKTSTCGCKPRAQGHVTLEGKTADTEQAKILGAVKEAVDQENADVDSSHLSVEIIKVEDTQDDGKDISTVTYRVDCVNKGCDVETLKAPSRAVLEQSLGQVGKTLYSKAEPTEKEERKWLIPVAVACGVVLFVIIICVICCIMYRRRKQDKWRVDSPVSAQKEGGFQTTGSGREGT
ncbi:uncharacterized protein LOC128555750 isoform X2 [Mercenaria mercenaria]|uniref:uncharacterized protein LOC128555750 isoform X2 n=1 Tax=Mercenaria mercenaria TaxID=6596 RepID=UPI00234F274E|nr:uncharacterized protein LOC128555750 isoform X2 [Mercenaria mercenaria]